MKRFFSVAIALFFFLGTFHAIANDLEVLDDLADDSLNGMQEDTTGDVADELSDLSSQPETEMESIDSGLSVNFGGYLKGLGYWNEERYSDDLWKKYRSMASLGPVPADQNLNGYNYIGTRMQFKLEAFLDDRARLFSAFNVNFNTTGSLHDTTSDANSAETGDIRMVESFIEIFEGSRIWKVGSQIVTWGYLEGIEVPTDRVNARDYSYKSTEYEDGKLASTGLLLTQTMAETALDIMYVPVARSNIGMEFQDYFYPGEDETIERKPNNGKWATRFSGSMGDLDYSLSYLEGPDSNADLVPTPIIATGMDPNTGEVLYTVLPGGRKYNRIKSPGLDLQYNLGSFLAKGSYVQVLTEDQDGDDYFIKNNWSKYVIGAEFTVLGKMVNLSAGQHLIEEFKEDPVSGQTNFLMGQLRERTDFVSGHINADFLTGNALNLVLLAAGYWDKEGEPVQTNIKTTAKYKVANGLDLVFSSGYMDILDNKFVDHQFEIKVSF